MQNIEHATNKTDELEKNNKLSKNDKLFENNWTTKTFRYFDTNQDQKHFENHAIFKQAPSAKFFIQKNYDEEFASETFVEVFKPIYKHGQTLDGNQTFRSINQWENMALMAVQKSTNGNESLRKFISEGKLKNCTSERTRKSHWLDSNFNSMQSFNFSSFTDSANEKNDWRLVSVETNKTIMEIIIRGKNFSKFFGYSIKEMKSLTPQFFYSDLTATSIEIFPENCTLDNLPVNQIFVSELTDIVNGL